MADDVFDEEFIDEISLVNPSTNVNDENFNLPIQELQHNLRFLLNLISVSSASSPNYLSLLYGNLLDYDSAGQRVFFNGGNMDCFEKKNAWIAVDDGEVTNDIDIQTEGADRLLVYSGGVSITDENGQHGRYLQREFYIPPQLRGTELIFAVKGTGVYTQDPHEPIDFDYEIPYCDASMVPGVSAVGEPPCITSGTTGTTGTTGTPTTGCPTTGTTASPDIPGITCVPDLTGGCYARYEDVGIEIIGALDVVEEIVVLGPWPHHSLYAEQDEWLPEYRTAGVAFRVGQNTSSIKVRIRRTRADGAIAIPQFFLGGLPKPWNDYEIQDLDINELYNFNLGITKWNVTTVDGRHVAEDCGGAKLPNLMTKEQWLCLSQFNRKIDEFDWDVDNGPRPNELEFLTSPTGVTPKTHGLEFDPGFTRYAHFDMRVDGPDPGLCYLGISYFVNENEFADEPLSCCPGGTCGDLKFDVWVAVVNTGDYGNPSDVQYKRFSYTVPVPDYVREGRMGYFEIYGDFYEELKDERGALAYFIVSRDGESDLDTLNGNFILVGCKTGLAIPTDDIPEPRDYPGLFVGDNSEC